MKPPFLAALCVTVTLTACGGFQDSRLNPFNWFGNSSEKRIAQKELPPAERADPRSLVADVASMKVERVPGGALLTAVGVSPTQGFWRAELVPDNPDERAENGNLIYTFRIVPPTDQQLVSTKQSRSVTVGLFLSDQTLDGVRRIVVRGQTNERSVRR